MALFLHFATGFYAKYFFREMNLFLMVFAAGFLDFLLFLPFPSFVQLKLDSTEDYFICRKCWTHGLLMGLFWTFNWFVLSYFWNNRKIKPAVVLSSLVFGHWIIDAITHPLGSVLPAGSPEASKMPLLFDHTFEIGFGLFNHSAIFSLALDIGSFVIGVIVYFLKVKKKEV